MKYNFTADVFRSENWCCSCRCTVALPHFHLLAVSLERKNSEESSALAVLVHVYMLVFVWADLCGGSANLWQSLFVSSTLYLAELSVRPSDAVEEVKPWSNTLLCPSRSCPSLSK